MGYAARANQASQEPAPFVLSIPIAKVDAEKRLVTGVVTQEVLDKQGDIVDYDAAKALFSNAELWPGNIREMHQPKAVGKAVEVECDDANKTISLTARVSKGAADTWEKVLDGTLSMYSLGGSGRRVAEKASGAMRLFLDQLAEVSLVDSGACPTAKFEIVKTADGQLVDAQPVEPVEADIVPNIAAIAQKGIDALDAALMAAQPVVEPIPEADTVELPKTRVMVVDAAKALMAKLANRAAVSKAAQMEPWDIDAALGVISGIEHMMATEVWSAGMEQDANPVELAQVEMLKGAMNYMLAFLASEYAEQFDDSVENEDAEVVSAGVELFVKGVALVQKAGARHSKDDLDMIQKVHDLAGSLGAACKMAEADAKAVDDGDGDVVAAKAVAVPVTDHSEPIQKLTAELDTTKAALSEQKVIAADQAKAITALTERLTAFENRPADGGPVRNAQAVEKALGGPSDAGGASSPEAVVKALQTLAESGDDVVRAAAAREILKVQHATGMNRVEMRPRQ